jgi:hypothetical protein
LFEIILTELICNWIHLKLIIFVSFQLSQNLLHAFDSIMMLKIISKHFEDDFTKREEIFIGFIGFLFLSEMYVQNLYIDAPDYIVKNVREKCHQMF